MRCIQPLPTQLDLFGASSIPADRLRSQQAFDVAFDHWQDSARDGEGASHGRRLKRSSSQDAYRDLWGTFAHWCVFEQASPLDIDAIETADLERFLMSREELLLAKPRQRAGAGAPQQGLSSRYVWRTLTLIDRVLSHRARMLELPPNRAPQELLESREEWLYANARRRDAPAVSLPPAQAARLVSYLWGCCGRSPHALRSWQEVRNHAAVALHLGAGLTPAQVRALTLDCVVVDGGQRAGVPWKLRVAALGETPAHEAPLAAWAGGVLATWLRVRLDLPDLRQKVEPAQPAARLGPATQPVLFPASPRGRAWSKLSHYKSTIEVLDASGIEKDLILGGAYRLRHTFALRQLRRGESPERVARWLGVVEPDVMQRYLALVDNSQQPV